MDHNKSSFISTQQNSTSASFYKSNLEMRKFNNNSTLFVSKSSFEDRIQEFMKSMAFENLESKDVFTEF